MLLIYAPKITNRLGYTLNVVFHSILRTEFSITTDEHYFLEHADAKLAYNDTRLGNAPYIKSDKLLFETSIQDQELGYFEHEGIAALFPVYGRDLDLPFDPLAATFYMVSRYEEYLPHHEDMHNRFTAAESIAYQKGFLQCPVVDYWALMIKELIKQHYPKFEFPQRTYEFIETIDIDLAYCYKQKGVFRTMMGLARDGLHRRQLDEVRNRIRTITGHQNDPYDTFDYILAIRNKYKGIKLLFFPLLADYGVYDKPISYHNTEFRQLLQHLGDHSKLGIHTSYSALDDPTRIDKEAKRLSDILHRPIVRNRFHFLRFQLPRSYRALVHGDIRHDYSMGYADIEGFRAGITSPYPFYDLENDIEIDLTIHPFSVMDSTMQKHRGLTPEQAIECYKKIIDQVRAVDGTFSGIWHNQNLCEMQGWEGWREVYETVIDYAAPACRTEEHIKTPLQQDSQNDQL